MDIIFGKNRIDNFLIKDVKNVYEYAIEFLGIDSKNLEVNIEFVSPLKIKKMNNKFRGVNKVTDILSFPFLLKPNVEGMQLIEQENFEDKFKFSINPESGNIVLGDLYICFSKMKKQAKEYGTGIQREFTYLCLHGLLHLLGYDHIKESDKKIMREKEEIILKNVFENVD